MKGQWAIRNRSPTAPTLPREPTKTRTQVEDLPPYSSTECIVPSLPGSYRVRLSGGCGTRYRQEYNPDRLHSSLAYQPPAEFPSSPVDRSAPTTAPNEQSSWYRNRDPSLGTSRPSSSRCLRASSLSCGSTAGPPTPGASGKRSEPSQGISVLSVRSEAVDGRMGAMERRIHGCGGNVLRSARRGPSSQ